MVQLQIQMLGKFADSLRLMYDVLHYCMSYMEITVISSKVIMLGTSQNFQTPCHQSGSIQFLEDICQVISKQLDACSGVQSACNNKIWAYDAHPGQPNCSYFNSFLASEISPSVKNFTTRWKHQVELFLLLKKIVERTFFFTPIRSQCQDIFQFYFKYFLMLTFIF